MSWLVDTLLVSGALIALVLLLRRPVARIFGPGMAYALWALPLLRLLIPPITLPADPVEAAPLFVTVLTNPDPVSAAPAPAWTLAPLLQAVWLGGALAYLGWRLWQYRAMRRRLLAGAIGVGEAEGVRLVEAPEVRSPVAFGLRDRVVALPPGFMAMTPRRERDLAIAHELEHHRGRDLAVNIAMQPLLALHWFNPLAWAGWRALRRDQEAACDARVLAGREADTRAAYGRLIAAFACNPSPTLASPLACPILPEKSIVHRLRSLTMTEPTKTRRLAGRLLIGAAALALPLTATITYAGNETASPVTPKAPAAPEPGQINKVHKIVIVDVPEGASPDDKDLHVRTIERNGKTIVLKTKQPLSDAEAEDRIAKAEASLQETEGMTWVSAEAAGTDKPHIVRRVVIKHGEGAEIPAAVAVSPGAAGGRVPVVIVREVGPHGAHAPQPPEPPVPPQITMLSKREAKIDCAGGRPVTATVERNEGGSRTGHVVVLCAKGKGVEGLRVARDRVAADPAMPSESKAEVLKQLDAQIEQMAKEG